MNSRRFSRTQIPATINTISVPPQKPKAVVYLNSFDPVDIEANPQAAEKFVALEIGRAHV